ncbi:MAG: RidA family protein [Pseudomonadota bacterium]|nr:RidA family protein [Pseudomonadota bacterium]
MEDSKILTKHAKPRGKYPHAHRSGDLVFVSGTSSRNADNSIVGAEVDSLGTTQLDIRQQTEAVLKNIGKILGEFNLGLDDIVEITTFLVSMNDFGGYNDVYGRYFSYDGPARTTVAVHQLPHPHLLIEIKAIARINPKKTRR